MDANTSVKSGGSSTSLGTKRKRQDQPKFYAVRVGHRPGVYPSWAECVEQIKGFKKAIFKSFPTQADAESFMAGHDPTTSITAKFYAVKSGRVPGIYTDWPTAQAQIVGWQKPRQRAFHTRVEAQAFMDSDEAETGKDLNGSGAIPADFFSHNDVEAPQQEPPQPQVSKRAKKATNGVKSSKIEEPPYREEDFEPGTGPLPPGAEDGFDPNIFFDPVSGKIQYKSKEQRQATKVTSVLSPTAPIRIHTDGSSLRNGQTGALAGVGVYFGPGDKRNVSETLPGARQTNQRAELTAVLRALEIVPRHRNVTIISDSRYAIDCVTTWYVNWRKNGWKNAAGKAVENRDTIENILARIEDRQRLNVRTDFEWVKGHAASVGNQEADKLAVQGAKSAHDVTSL